MANNMECRDAYIIIGIDEEKECSIQDVKNDSNRRNTQKMVDFLRDKKFAGGVRPRVVVEPLQVEDGEIDIIIIKIKRKCLKIKVFGQLALDFFLTKIKTSDVFEALNCIYLTSMHKINGVNGEKNIQYCQNRKTHI